MSIPKNLENFPEEDTANWDPQVKEQKLFIRNKDGLYNKLNEAVKLKVNISLEEIQELLDKHFYFRGE